MINRRLTSLIAAAAFVLLLASCGGNASRKAGEDSGSASGEAAALHKITMPMPPAMLTDDSSRLVFMADHYWDTFDASDTTWIADTAALEQAFANWAALLGALPQREAVKYPGALIRRAGQSPEVLLRLSEIAEHYFADPNSPYRSEELFIPVLEAVLESRTIDTLYKIRPRLQLASAMKNRPGTKAADIAYTTGSGATGTLYGLRADYTLVIFYNPGCPDCARTESYIERSEVFGPLAASGRLKVLAIYPDEDMEVWRSHLPQMPAGWIVGRSLIGRIGESPYDLPAIPALYLLDKDKRVILKDAPVERIEAWLDSNPSCRVAQQTMEIAGLDIPGFTGGRRFYLT